MKRIVLCVAALAAVSTVLAGFKYEGQWGSRGTGPGHFTELYGVDVAPDGNVYVADNEGRIQYFTPTGSYLGKWTTPGYDVAVAPNGNVYTGGGCTVPAYYLYYTKKGSLLRTFWGMFGSGAGHGDIGPDGIVYAPEYDVGESPSKCKLYVARYKPGGAPVRSWEVIPPTGGAAIGVSPNGKRVYVAPINRYSILIYTYAGSFLRSWGSMGSGNGQFLGEVDVDVAPDGRVFAADRGKHRVQFFSPTGSFLGKWGHRGSGPGEFRQPVAIAVSPDGKRVYVADSGNYRIQYFNRSEPSVAPTSLGRVKALFK